MLWFLESPDSINTMCIKTAIQDFLCMLNQIIYLFSLLASPEHLSMGDTLLKLMQCSLALFFTAAGLLKLLVEGLTPPLQLINTGLQFRAPRSLLE